MHTSQPKPMMSGRKSARSKTVEYHLENDDQFQHLDAPARRRLARLWGLVYIYDQGETPDEGDTNAPNTTLATPGTTPPVTPA